MKIQKKVFLNHGCALIVNLHLLSLPRKYGPDDGKTIYYNHACTSLDVNHRIDWGVNYDYMYKSIITPGSHFYQGGNIYV